MAEILPEADTPGDLPTGDAALNADPNYDRIVYPVKRTPGKSFLYDFLDQNLKSAYYRRLLHEGK